MIVQAVVGIRWCVKFPFEAHCDRSSLADRHRGDRLEPWRQGSQQPMNVY
jgi:hypothetical protein